MSSLAQLRALPAEVLFVDDRSENIAAAETLGLATATFTSAATLESEIGLILADR